jgi:hypothetical protein
MFCTMEPEISKFTVVNTTKVPGHLTNKKGLGQAIVLGQDEDIVLYLTSEDTSFKTL